ncbi:MULTISPECIES: AraC family transcriptional regulator [unclassified Pseudomonas]|uniref:helix-turn-helix transcriptional regulator n=1 Tax=unclassified Pseudomonas TaxID=196821 RepID=UPI001AE69E71|nr:MULTISPECIES: AraC family transcriptional regulator [unclassified Pseudomonas]MBP2271625.1 AraC-like DNA-binding protein [Pseudomonas sp. BP6]MBP2289404.1 AraC-like DNA-binding protein [Pseudomonas sp. BP7]HDS1694960.1 AraC family transcriptional regulator [Pseudomonas putida]HDS1700130.1 AraC family transcriptional regulator [Pseudomonas putida]
MPRSHAALWRDPALPHVESRRACHSRACYKAHSHPTFSIGAVDAGRSHFTGAADGQHHLAPGTLVLVPAHRVHACNPAPGLAWSYQMLHVDADWLTQLRLESGLGGIEAGEPVRICREAEVYRQFCALNRLLFSSACNGEKDAALIAFLGDLDVSAHPPLAAAPALEAATLSGLLARIEHQDPAQLSLEVLAREAGLGRYQLIRAFRAATGFTPHAYLLNARVNRGRQLLSEGLALAEVAYQLGFADQSHFQRVFKAHVGVTPGQYRGN